MTTSVAVSFISLAVGFAGMASSMVSVAITMFSKSVAKNNRKLLFVLNDVEEIINHGPGFITCRDPQFLLKDDALELSRDVNQLLTDFFKTWSEFITMLASKEGPFDELAPLPNQPPRKVSFGFHPIVLGRNGQRVLWMKVEHKDVLPFKQKLAEKVSKIKREIEIENRIYDDIFSKIKSLSKALYGDNP